MDYRDYLARLRACSSDFEVVEYGSVRENGRDYPLLRLTTPGAREFVVTSGFHGEEPAGPLTLLQHLPEFAAEARAQGVGLRVYPCINPSGFEGHHRYNASGEKPNNDLLRYEHHDGTVVGELHERLDFKRHYVHHGGPKETRALAAALEAGPVPHAALDIHQDDYVLEPMSYAYTFGDKRAFRPLVEASAAFAAIARNYRVDEHSTTDADGLIEFHDGSVTDYFWRRGVPFVAALETTTRTPMARCDEINRIWIRGFIGLAARGLAR